MFLTCVACVGQTFEGRVRDYLVSMCNQRIQNVEQVVGALEVRSNLDPTEVSAACEQSSTMPQCGWDLCWEGEFYNQLVAYLRGVGHPDHPDVRAVVGEERFDRERDDPLLRARLFMAMISGSDLVPEGNEWKVKVHFIGSLRLAPLGLITNVSVQLFFKHSGDRKDFNNGAEVPLPAPVSAPSFRARVVPR